MHPEVHAAFITDDTVSQCPILVPCRYLVDIAIAAGTRGRSKTRRSMQGRSSRNAKQLVQACGTLGLLGNGALKQAAGSLAATENVGSSRC